MEKEENQNNTPIDQNQELEKENTESKENLDSTNNQETKQEVKEEIKEPTPKERIAELEDKVVRTFAEMENQRRRFEKERNEAFEFGGFNFAKESLTLIDNIDRAITSFKNDETLKKNSDLNKIIDGIDIVKKDLVSIFKKNGVEVIECLNKKFDPNFHQAMLEVEDNSKESGIVVEEMQKGYMMKGRLLRPSLVGVTKKSEKKGEKEANGAKKSEEK